MAGRSLRLRSVAGAAAAPLPGDGQAQIYAWRDASGNLVLSDKAKDPSAKSYSAFAGADTTLPDDPAAQQARRAVSGPDRGARGANR